MDDITLRNFTLKALKEIIGDVDENTLELKFKQGFKDKVDVYGKFENKNGLYEFALSFDEKGKVKRSHVNLIMPKDIKDEMERRTSVDG
ncbi:hypothetical protein [Stygiolobus caldivivus]|uniref:Uncharacterized protein n=1 Tax=Stygiolobus caldivivus TaxID=2824673 RepID=A0A8D5U7B4_9CREN|nr:hypothetical protein [Stygiolobus caldivivus]BCU70385.1 hypothetical protein KN1_16820 [Stygiolobus caldivivus]